MATKLAFTTLRADADEPLFWSAHWQRLQRSWQYFQGGELRDEQELLVRLRKHFSQSDEKVVRVDLLESNGRAGFEINARALTCRDDEQGLRLSISQERLSKRTAPTWLKVGNYQKRFDARNLVQTQGYDEVLYLDPKGFIAEATVSNILWVKERRLFAPAANEFFLQGLTTNLLQNKAKNDGFEVQNGSYDLQHLINADAIWLVNAVTGPVRVIQLQDKRMRAISPQLDLDQLYWQLIKEDREKRREQGIEN